MTSGNIEAGGMNQAPAITESDAETPRVIDHWQVGDVDFIGTAHLTQRIVAIELPADVEASYEAMKSEAGPNGVMHHPV